MPAWPLPREASLGPSGPPEISMPCRQRDGTELARVVRRSFRALRRRGIETHRRLLLQSIVSPLFVWGMTDDHPLKLSFRSDHRTYPSIVVRRSVSLRPLPRSSFPFRLRAPSNEEIQRQHAASCRVSKELELESSIIISTSSIDHLDISYNATTHHRSPHISRIRNMTFNLETSTLPCPLSD